MSVCSTETMTAPDNEVNIINRREIAPLLAKSRQVLAHYEKAIGCSATVVDRSGIAIKTSEYKKEMRFCDFCKKYSHNSSQIWQGNEYPCDKMHLAALAESRRTEETYIYTCEVGFIYWTSPLYRNGRYAGALIAGQVLSDGHKNAAEKFRDLCKDKVSTEKFSKMIGETAVKSHMEIQAMARLLGVCAGEISVKGEDPGEKIRRLIWQKGNMRNMKELVKTQEKKMRLSRQTGFSHTAASDQAERPDDSEYSLENERILLAAFRRGDNETGDRILKELMDSIILANPDDLDIIRFRAIELVVLLSRAAVSDTSNNNAMLEINNRYLKRIQESRTTEELIENLHHIADRMASKIFSFQGIRHASVLRKAERYIWGNYTRKISLEEIARASGLSAPYFSTIFKEERGENLSSYLNRLRVEKAAALLTETGKPLNEIARLCGFEDQSWFSKIFKNYAGISPGKYRENGGGTPEFMSEKNKFPESPLRNLPEQDIQTS